jgi:hypothetical protein
MNLKFKIAVLSVVSIISVYILSSFNASMDDDLLYHLELSDPSTYTVSCFEQLSSKWKVSNKKCILETSTISIPESNLTNLVDIPVKININGSGNLDKNDFAVFQFFSNNKWNNIDSIQGENIPAEPTTFKYFVKKVSTNSKIKFRLIFSTNSESKYIVLYSKTDSDFSVEKPYVSGTFIPLSTSLLPVELFSFTGKIINNRIFVEWITEFEFNNNYFSLEKSYNGIDFKTINEIKGFKYSNSKQKYSVFDEYSKNPNIFYRLKQTDLSNNKTYFDIIYVNNQDSIQNDNIRRRVYPNPCFGKCIIDLESKSDTSKYLNFLTLDALGNITTNNISKTMLDSSTFAAFDVDNNFKPGVFVVRLNNKNANPKN